MRRRVAGRRQEGCSTRGAAQQRWAHAAPAQLRGSPRATAPPPLAPPLLQVCHQSEHCVRGAGLPSGPRRLVRRRLPLNPRCPPQLVHSSTRAAPATERAAVACLRLAGTSFCQRLHNRPAAASATTPAAPENPASIHPQELSAPGAVPGGRHPAGRADCFGGVLGGAVCSGARV